MPVEPEMTPGLEKLGGSHADLAAEDKKMYYERL